MPMSTLAYNKRVRFDYTILENFEAGIVLTGAEVKACKLGKISLAGAYVSLEKGELWLKNAQIYPYQINNQKGYDPLRLRKLLVKRGTIAEFVGKLQTAGLTLLVESLYTTRSFVKAKVVLARGKKLHDKRASIKKREVDRRIARALRHKL